MIHPIRWYRGWRLKRAVIQMQKDLQAAIDKEPGFWKAFIAAVEEREKRTHRFWQQFGIYKDEPHDP